MPLLRKSHASIRVTRSSKHLLSTPPKKIPPCKIPAKSNQKKHINKIKINEKTQNKDIPPNTHKDIENSLLSRKTRSSSIMGKRDRQQPDLSISSESPELSEPSKWRMQATKNVQKQKQTATSQKALKVTSLQSINTAKIAKKISKKSMTKAITTSAHIGRAGSSNLQQKTTTPCTTPSTSLLLHPNYSPRRTRSLHRQELEDGHNRVTKCFQCHQTPPIHTLRSCPNCNARFHLDCLNLQPETVEYLDGLINKWRCPRCIICDKCGEYIADSDNVQCLFCARAWHGFCRPKTTKPPEYPYNRWICDACTVTSEALKYLQREHTPEPQCISPTDSLFGTQIIIPFEKEKQISQRRNSRSNIQVMRSRLLRSTGERLEEKQSEHMEYENTFALEMRQTRSMAQNAKFDNTKALTHSLGSSTTMACNEIKNRLNKFHISITDAPNIDSVRDRDKQMIGHQDIQQKKNKLLSQDNLPEQNKFSTNNFTSAIRSNSPKTTKILSITETYPRIRTSTKDVFNRLQEKDDEDNDDCDEIDTDALRMRVLAEMGLNSENKSNKNVHNQWIQFGQFVRFRPLYESAYHEPINSALVIYICEFCLTPLSVMEQFKNHLLYCRWRYPPGNEIYRESREQWNIWEVEGCMETSYCRNLCLMAKLFLASKTLYHEVETFTFYILTEITPRGCSIVGYFSKEKNPSKNNNLSCLLALPSAQGKGYGKLLIDLSYQLSKLEHKIGSPEHPLSDMGLLAYRSYWRAVLFCALRQRRNTQVVSLKDLSIETAIHSYDIVSTLLANDMLHFLNDSHYIDINKALNTSLAALRRRFIRPQQLKWMPPFEPDPYCKMNSYVSCE